MTIMVVDHNWTSLRRAADNIVRQNAAVSVVLKDSIAAAEQFAMYHPVDMVFVRSGMLSDELFQKVKYYQPMTECYVLGKDQNILPFLCPYIL